MRKIHCIFIRHGITQGNKEKRYIGQKSDEVLCDEGIAGLKAKQYRFAGEEGCIFVSPMQRCVQSAQILFPNKQYISVDGFKETDFGDFEGKNYIELSDNQEYIKWIESDGKLPFPNGESREIFIGRTLAAFEDVIAESNEDDMIFVIHGGSIMAIMSALTGEDYFSFHIDCGNGYSVECCVEEGKINVLSYDCLFNRGDS